MISYRVGNIVKKFQQSDFFSSHLSSMVNEIGPKPRPQAPVRDYFTHSVGRYTLNNFIKILAEKILYFDGNSMKINTHTHEFRLFSI